MRRYAPPSFSTLVEAYFLSAFLTAYNTTTGMYISTIFKVAYICSYDKDDNNGGRLIRYNGDYWTTSR